MIRLPIRVPVPVVVVASAITLTLMPFAPANAEVVEPEPIVVQLPEGTDVVADDATQRVFVSTGGHDSVEVFDWSGNAVDSLTGIDNVRALALDAASGTVYAAQGANDKIAAIDTTTLDVTQFSVSATPGLATLTVMNGLVYYSYNGGVGVLDPNAADAQGAKVFETGLSGTLIGAANDTVVLAEAGISPTNPRSYALTELGGVEIAYRWNTGSNAQDVAMSPDGEEVLVVSGAPYEHQAFDPLTLETLYTYQSAAYPVAAAYSADGSLVATGTGFSDDDVRLHNRGETIAFDSWNLDVASLDATMVDGGLAFGGKTHLFAVAQDYSDDTFSLTIIEFDQRAPSTISVDASSGATVGDDVEVTGQLFGGDPGALAALEGEDVTVTRRRGGVTTTVGTAVVDENGSFAISDTTTAGGTHKYTATWPGNDTFVAATASTTSDVGYLASTVGISLDANRYVTGSEATVTVTLGHDDQRTGTVAISAVDFRGTHELATGSFDETGTYQTTVPVTRTGKLVAEYIGNDTYGPASAKSTRFDIEAAVTTAVDGYFRKRGDVWLVRENVDPTVTWTVSPRPITSGCAETVLQTQTSDGWRVLRRSGCRNSDTRDTVVWTLSDDRVSGTQWRTRLVTDASPTHLPIHSEWAYLTFRALSARVK